MLPVWCDRGERIALGFSRLVREGNRRRDVTFNDLQFSTLAKLVRCNGKYGPFIGRGRFLR